MKKLIATAVAATVSAYAVADISITGSMKANYTVTDYADSRKADTDKFSTEGDLKILGKSGDTTVVMNFGNIDSAEGDTAQTMTAEDTYVKTKIGDVNVQMGNYDSGNNEMRDSSRVNRVKLSTDIAGFGVSYTNGNGGDGANRGGNGGSFGADGQGSNAGGGHKGRSIVIEGSGSVNYVVQGTLYGPTVNHPVF